MKAPLNFIRRSEIGKLAKDFKIIGFGAGQIGDFTVAHLNEQFSYFIDNNNFGKNCSPYWKNKIIVHPFDFLEKENPQKIAVIICTERYLEVAEDLFKKHPQVKVFISPLLKEYKTLSRYNKATSTLVISGYGGSGGIYTMNTVTGAYELKKAGSFRGLTTSKGHLYSVLENGDIIEVHDGKNFVFKTKYLSKENIWAHGIVYSKDSDSFIVVASKKDSLFEFDANTFTLNKIYKYKHCEAVDQYIHHFNDLCIIDGSFYISVISLSGFWQTGTYDGVYGKINFLDDTYDIDVVTNDLRFPHSLTAIEENLFYLDSTRGNLMTNENTEIATFNGFVRGLTGNKDLIYIGQSRERRVKDALKYRKTISFDSGIYVYERESKTYRFWKLPDMLDVYALFDLTAL